MKYAFLSDVLGSNMDRIGGPQSYSRGIETLLKRYADFEYIIVRGHFKDFLKSTDIDIVHVQSNMGIIIAALRRNVRLIVGPSVVWQTATQELLHYPKMGSALIVRPDPYPRKLNPEWMHKVKSFPPFVDEKFFVPSGNVKDIDVLTISKSFHYPEYELNLRKLIMGIKSLKLKHLHLDRYSLKQYKNALDRSKVLLFPSPRESGASTCFALLECSMMDVPFIGLESVINPHPKEFNVCRGVRVKSIQGMLEKLPFVLEEKYHPRAWTEARFSMQMAYNRLRAIIEFAMLNSS